MTKREHRQPKNAVLRERINRLHDLHTQLHTLTTQAFQDVLDQVRGGKASDTGAVLDDMIRRYIDRLHTQQAKIEQEFSALAKGGLLTDEELAALVWDHVPGDGSDKG
jgi:predicted transcriptional regulator